jgi:putative Holliday junction resolvase
MNDFSHYPRFQEFQGLKILAVDFGLKVTGTAMFCPGRDPFPYMAEKIIYKSHDETIKAIKSLADNEDIDIVVLGVPFFIDGKESTQTVLVREFGELLKKALSEKKYFEQDETLTTKTAEERMKNSPEFNFKVDPTKIDCLSAVIILEDFIRN